MSEFLIDSAEVVTAYKELRSRILVLCEQISAEDAQKIVPATPDWTVKYLLCHLVGVPQDFLAGRMEGVASEAWTAAQVELLGSLSVPELADLLRSSAPQFDEILPMIPQPVISQFVMDAVTHEHDLRGVINSPGARDSAGVDVAIGFLFDIISRVRPTLLKDVVNSPVSKWDLLRSLSGRRTIHQMEELGLPASEIFELMKVLPLDVPDAPVE
jgi:hypothetical protein